MDIHFKAASDKDAAVIANFVVKLTAEICQLTDTQHFDLNLSETTRRCQALIKDGHLSAIIGFDNNTPVAVVTMTETYALYAEGKIGLIQEFYVCPEFRAIGVGSILIEQVRQHGIQRDWSCIELCTPPLPEFERTLQFYQSNGLNPVGGRKMRQSLNTSTTKSDKY